MTVTNKDLADTVVEDMLADPDMLADMRRLVDRAIGGIDERTGSDAACVLMLANAAVEIVAARAAAESATVQVAGAC